MEFTFDVRAAFDNVSRTGKDYVSFLGAVGDKENVSLVLWEESDAKCISFLKGILKTHHVSIKMDADILPNKGNGFYINGGVVRKNNISIGKEMSTKTRSEGFGDEIKEVKTNKEIINPFA